jgi:protein-disulfide isomerase
MAAFELEKLLEEHPTVRLVFKNFPLDRSCNRSMQRDLHEFACEAAFAARCAGEQGDAAFSRAYKQLFSYSALSASTISDLPTQVGLNPNKFGDCMESKRTEQRVAKDVDEAIRLGIQGTPTIFINGKRLPKWHIGALQLIVKHLAARNGAAPTHKSTE